MTVRVISRPNQCGHDTSPYGGFADAISVEADYLNFEFR